VKAGYDVWLANLRGNKYSKKHISLDIKSAEFWNFGWEEVA
jgi:lysosomal acid lipase/cholesteryl ester hydrolase